MIEYKIDGFGSDDDLNRRWEVQELIDKLLTNTGLGVCDGGSMGSNTMEVCCFVTNFEQAKKIIMEALADTQYSDYNRIIEENEEYWQSVSKPNKK